MAFQIIRNDITKVSADAIVNTANPDPVFARGTDAAVYRAAGAERLLSERKKIGYMKPGQAAATPAFDLPAHYIIHTVGPVWQGGDYGEKEIVRDCYENSLRLADKLGCESIAFPLIATGIYGFPKADALQIAIDVFSRYLSGSDSDNDMEILLVVFDEESFVLSGKIFAGVRAFIDEHYVADRMEMEYESASIPQSYRVTGSKPADLDGRERRRRLWKKAEAPCDAPSEAMQDEKADFRLGQAKSGKEHRSLEDLMVHVADSWQETLFRLIDEKGYTDTEVYKRANIDRKLFSKIRSNTDYRPKKKTAVAFALALKLNLDETRDFLSRAGYALSPSSRFDLIIQYFIEQEMYDIYTINLALFDHRQDLLGS